MFSLVGTLEYAAPEIHNANQMVPRSQGYSKAVDMWSIGSITAAMLSGDVLFTDRKAYKYHTNPKEVIMGLASKCDISIIDDDEDRVWCRVGRRAKDFIKNLLILNESDRMTVTKALEHAWFTNEFHAAEFEALYERSIKHWVPRRKSARLVESISLRRIPTSQARQEFSDTQCQTQNSQLPIAEEYEEADFEGPSFYEQQIQECLKEAFDSWKSSTRLSCQCILHCQQATVLCVYMLSMLDAKSHKHHQATCVMHGSIAAAAVH